MKISYDAEADALSITFRETTVTTKHLGGGHRGGLRQRGPANGAGNPGRAKTLWRTRNHAASGAGRHGCIIHNRQESAQRPPMKLHVDKGADALYLQLDDSKIIESDEVAPGVILDYNDRNEVVGIEMLYLSRRSQALDTTALEIETV